MNFSMTSFSDEMLKLSSLREKWQPPSKEELKALGKNLLAYSAGTGAGAALGYGAEKLVNRYAPLLSSGQRKFIAGAAGVGAGLAGTLAMRKALRNIDDARKRNS